MMYCNRCGKQIPDDSVFCSGCGAKVAPAVSAPVQEPMPAPEAASPQTPAPEPATPVPAAPQPPQDQQEFRPYCPPPEAPKTPEHPMRWFKFIIYVQLFLSALGYLWDFVCYLSGIHYGEDAELVYKAFPGIDVLDMGMALLCLGMAVFAIVVRVQLAKFKRTGPMLLQIFLAVGISMTLAYLVAAIIITRQNLVTVSTVSSIIALLVMLVCNFIYFGRRKDLFVN